MCEATSAPSRKNPDDEGFGLVELVIALLLLTVIAVAILPALYNGIRYAASQSSAATATRQLNSLIEQARQVPSCSSLTNAAATQTFHDGAGHPITTSGTVGTCASGSAVSISLKATAQSGDTLASVSALVYVP